MANITAAMVKELRERTGSGMMECKKALTEADGDMEAAIEAMRKSGLAKADKKSGRTAAEGCICVKLGADQKSAAIVEVNCETDFVAKGDDFIAFANNIAQCALDSSATTSEELLAVAIPATGVSIDDTRRELVAKIGENLAFRRFERYVSDNGIVVSYLHGTRIGVLVELVGGTVELGRDIAMHIAASKPLSLDESGIPAETIAKEREIAKAQAEAEGKPANIIEKMVEGRVRKFLGEVTLLGQPFVKDDKQSVGKLLADNKASVVRYVRFEVGEGIEKVESDFAAEVMAQAGLA
ncbi:translation elongation factor Ts [Methylomagnum ishizawai]|uniref:translation elongation factor Ts n=1 Tax=Methylomagnum ishizawai TaxID=1760988 RepID=UPI001C32675E|nr:translation elongation factor Ts [Methylomagnum ishizawai]BBL76732.1 elongation factor Ts [Methylomagnum ishizawai]